MFIGNMCPFTILYRNVSIIWCRLFSSDGTPRSLKIFVIHLSHLELYSSIVNPVADLCIGSSVLMSPLTHGFETLLHAKNSSHKFAENLCKIVSNVR